MTLFQQFLIALGIDAATVVAFYPALHLKGGTRTVVLFLLGLICASSPLAITPGHPTVRLIAALFVSGIAVKFIDLGREAAAGRVPSVLGYIQFVENSFWHVYRRRPRFGMGRIGWNLRRSAIHFIIASIAFAVGILIFRINWTHYPFLLEHVAKVLAVYAILVPLTTALAAFWRLLGQPAMDTMRHPILAHSPADFWRRWNQPTQVFFHEHFFLPAGGWRAPIRATLYAFAFSAFAHEYVFDIAIGRVQGVQTAFFMLQGLACVATLRWRPKGLHAVVGWALTLAFNLATSVIFFISVGQVAPFYAARGH